MLKTQFLLHRNPNQAECALPQEMLQGTRKERCLATQRKMAGRRKKLGRRWRFLFPAVNSSVIAFLPLTASRARFWMPDFMLLLIWTWNLASSACATRVGALRMRTLAKRKRPPQSATRLCALVPFFSTGPLWPALAGPTPLDDVWRKDPQVTWLLQLSSTCRILPSPPALLV